MKATSPYLIHVPFPQVIGIVSRMFSRTSVSMIERKANDIHTSTFGCYTVTFPGDIAGAAGRITFLAADEQHTEMETIVLLEDLYTSQPTNEQIAYCLDIAQKGDITNRTSRLYDVLRPQSTLHAPVVAARRLHFMVEIEKLVRRDLEHEINALRANWQAEGVTLSWDKDYPPNPKTAGYPALCAWIDGRIYHNAALTETAILEDLAERHCISLRTLQAGMRNERKRRGQKVQRGRRKKS